MRNVKTPDGRRVAVYPMAPDGHPDYGGEILGEDRWVQKNVHAYQDAILKVINDNDLYQYMDEPGRMSAEYRNIRKRDPDMPQLIKCVKLAMTGNLPSPMDPRFKSLVPEGWEAWPFPGPIMKGQTIDNADWIITQEMKAIWAFVLVNTRENPLDPNSKKFKQMATLSDVERARATKESRILLYRGSRKNKIIIPPGAALRFTLFDDPELPREFPDLELQKYDHTDPRHNPELRADGVYANMHAYVGEKSVLSEPARQVMVSGDE
jgi:hypothetical protein